MTNRAPESGLTALLALGKLESLRLFNPAKKLTASRSLLRDENSCHRAASDCRTRLQTDWKPKLVVEFLAEQSWLLAALPGSFRYPRDQSLPDVQRGSRRFH